MRHVLSRSLSVRADRTCWRGANRRPLHLAIMAFEDVEVLDFCRPFEVFGVASPFTDPAALILTVAEKPGRVVTVVA